MSGTIAIPPKELFEATIGGLSVLVIAGGADGDVLTLQSDGTYAPETPSGGGGSGDVVGPASATDNAVAIFNSTTGKLLQNSPVTISDAGGITAPFMTVSAGTSGTELVDGWTNNPSFPFETFVTSGSAITLAIDTGVYAFATKTVAVVSGVRYRATFTLTLNSGTAPRFAMHTDVNGSGPQINVRTAAGANTIEFTSTRTATDYSTIWCDFGEPASFSIAGFSLQSVPTPFTVAGGTALFSGGTFSDTLSSPKNTTTEAFGAGITAGAFATSVLVGNGVINLSAGSVVIGYGARSTATGYSGQDFGGQPVIVGQEAYGSGVAIGYKARATNYEAVAIGPQSRASGLATIAIGDAARALPSGPYGNQIIMGDVMWATGNLNYIIGGACGTAKDFVIGFGCVGSSITYDLDIATADHQGFLGWYQEDSVYFAGGAGLANDWWIGGPVTAASPHDITLNTTSGRGTDKSGVKTSCNASRGTGSGTPGTYVIATSVAGSSGASLQTLRDVIEFDGNATANETAVRIYDITAAALRRISIGAADSAGTGFRVLRIPN